MVRSEDIVNLLGAADIQVPAAGLRDDVALTSQGLDSMDMATLLHQVEVTYNVVITTEHAARMRQLKDIVDFLNAEGVVAPAAT